MKTGKERKLINLLRFMIMILFVITAISIFCNTFAGSEKPADETLSEDKKTPSRIGFKEKVTVVARLPEEEVETSRIPASVTVIDHEEIQNSGAQNIQELLFNIAGIVFFDDVGNGVETTIDLRGFNEGTSMAVLLDGVRINEPDDNRVNFEEIPLSSIERIEIFRGSSSSTFGAGAVSGTINIVTRELPLDNYLEMKALYGTNQTRQGRISSGLRLRKVSMVIDANGEDSNGFRENSEYSLSDIFFKMGGISERIGNLSFSYLRDKSDLGAPGSLTAEEMEQNRYFSPFNKVDGCKEKLDLITFGARKVFRKAGNLSATLFYRGNAIDTLTTGRWLMGFETQSTISSMGIISQHTSDMLIGHRKLSIVSGIESQMSDFESTGYFTDSNGKRYSSAPDSSNHTDLVRTGIFAQATMDISQIFSMLAGVRYDQDNLRFRDLIQRDIKGKKSFSETSFKSGISMNTSPNTGYYLLFAQAFLPPTVYDLFAFPLFGSNPALEPSKSSTFECGIKKKIGDRVSFTASLFRINMKDEVVFVLLDPANFTGMNENVGKSRRDGLEISSDLWISRRLSGFFSYTYIDAEIRSGINKGKKIPLVPKNRIAAGITIRAGSKSDILINLSGTYVGSQYLTGDDSNMLRPLDSYTLFNARISKQFKKVILFIDGKNLLDEQYATRGITNGFDLFFTPAPGRTISAGIELRYSL